MALVCALKEYFLGPFLGSPWILSQDAPLVRFQQGFLLDYGVYYVLQEVASFIDQ